MSEPVVPPSHSESSPAVPEPNANESRNSHPVSVEPVTLKRRDSSSSSGRPTPNVRDSVSSPLTPVEQVPHAPLELPPKQLEESKVLHAPLELPSKQPEEAKMSDS